MPTAKRNKTAIATYNKFQSLHARFWETSLVNKMNEVDFEKAATVMYVLTCRDKKMIKKLFDLTQPEKSEAV